MPNQIREVAPSDRPRSVRTAEGEILEAPSNWKLLPPGDAALSRRIKKEGAYWIVKEKRGRKVFSRGIWAEASRIDQLREELEQERSDPAYAKKLQAGRERREKEQDAYAVEFEATVLAFLNFSERNFDLARKMAKAISDHAVAVGSGTVARTKRISVERRAEAAAIAWMRHQTTAYDHMSIPRVKGMRREVRRMLAERSRLLLETYRDEYKTPAPDCPLMKALNHSR